MPIQATRRLNKIEQIISKKKDQTRIYTPYSVIDLEWYEEQLHRTFPNVDPWKFWPVIEEKLKPLEDPILAEFKESEEYHWWLKTKALKNQLKAEEDQAKAREEAERRRYEEQTWQQYQEHHQQTFTDRSPSSGGISLSQEETRIIDICYKAMAVQLHPDKGGNLEDMKILNQLKDKIRNRM